MFTEGTRAMMDMFNSDEWKGFNDYFDPYTSCVLIPDNIWDTTKELRDLGKKLLKFGKTFNPDGSEVKYRGTCWVMEYIQGYDENREHLGNDAWFISFRVVECWQ